MLLYPREYFVRKASSQKENKDESLNKILQKVLTWNFWIEFLSFDKMQCDVGKNVASCSLKKSVKVPMKCLEEKKILN